MVKHRATVGGPQPAELDRMLKTTNKNLAQQNDWIKESASGLMLHSLTLTMTLKSSSEVANR
jgi:phosphoribosyl-dephospho-CoA transferase